jgi:hypothetical protein
MAKDAAISVRLDASLKAELEEEAAKDGRSLAAYVERVLRLHHVPPVWRLRDCQPLNRKGESPSVVLPIAEGWPLAELRAEAADDLGQQLIVAAQLARGLPPAE